MIKQAIIPLAGQGTRLLPLTSVFAKELLPMNGKPGIEYIIEECIAEAKEINKDFDLVAAAKLARKKSIGPFRKKELNDKTKNKELGILSRAGFSYNIVKQVLFESDIEELEDLYDQR